jgi:hypothetical protein
MLSPLIKSVRSLDRIIQFVGQEVYVIRRISRGEKRGAIEIRYTHVKRTVEAKVVTL